MFVTVKICLLTKCVSFGRHIYLDLSDSRAFLESLILAKYSGLSNLMTALVVPGKYWVRYIKVRTGLQ